MGYKSTYTFPNLPKAFPPFFFPPNFFDIFSISSSLFQNNLLYNQFISMLYRFFTFVFLKVYKKTMLDFKSG